MAGPAVSRLAALALALAATGACNGDRTTAPDRGLSIEASISDASIGPAESMTITYRLQNRSALPRTVAFSCVPELRIDDDRGANVFPGNRGFICIAMHIPPQIVAPGEELTRTFTVSGMAGGSSIKLPVGRYIAAAEFRMGLSPRRQTLQLRSPEVSFEVTP
jgi:hypothetical protein